MAANWLQNMLVTNNQFLDPVLFLRSVGLEQEFLSLNASFVNILRFFRALPASIVLFQLLSCSSSFYRALPASIVLSQLFSCSPSFYRVSRTRRSVKIMNHFFNCSCLTYVCCKMKSRFVLQHQSPSRVTREFKM